MPFYFVLFQFYPNVGAVFDRPLMMQKLNKHNTTLGERGKRLEYKFSWQEVKQISLTFLIQFTIIKSIK